ncbi:11436_t:CDS:2 [Funneliformis geosporum]|uniref:15085_t:CDS:1 n=1 Tax=Funneliformis geosporum TaxID=1117311 RepID=A0A9W4SD04_9GLOM|nr:15085_t:CDS:2 [Funneliformis geosporum]CAI2171322.1 11436_t:CDS:2 [Funneliformis geosporum]
MFEDTNILRRRFNNPYEQNTNNTLQNTSSLRCKDTECLKVSQVNIDATTLRNTLDEVNLSEMTSSGLKGSGIRNQIIAQQNKVLPHIEPRKQEMELGINDLLEYDVENSYRKSEQTLIVDAVAELKEIISNSQYLYTSLKCQNDDVSLSSPACVPSQVWMNYNNVRKKFNRGISSPILRPQNPIPYHESFMNHDENDEDTLFPDQIFLLEQN